MPSPPSKALLPLADFTDLFETLAKAGTEQVVIGGCAVGAYAHLLGESVVSGDLDVYASPENSEAILAAVFAAGGRVLQRARPRSIPVSVLDWHGKELNVLTASVGLQSAAIEIELAREFVLPTTRSLSVLVADPFELLANKLALQRPKDRPHIAILRRFLESEVLLALREEREPRKRIGPASRLCSVDTKRRLSSQLAARMLELARLPSDFRFLASHVTSRTLSRLLLKRVAGTEAEATVRQIVERRFTRKR